MEQVKITNLTDEQISFQLILHSGNARNRIIQSLRAYKEGNKDEADALIAKAEQDLSAAHDIHFQMIQKESGGEAQAFSLSSHACGGSPDVNIIHERISERDA